MPPQLPVLVDVGVIADGEGTALKKDNYIIICLYLMLKRFRMILFRAALILHTSHSTKKFQC